VERLLTEFPGPIRLRLNRRKWLEMLPGLITMALFFLLLFLVKWLSAL
jgi:hypothetical protein